MDLGFVSAIFAEQSFEEVIAFAASHNFQCVEIMCWPKGQAERRYAGVTHIDVDQLNDGEIRHIKAILSNHNVYISGLGYYPNPLDPDEEKRVFYLGHIKKVIAAAAKLDIPVVNTFIGRHPSKSIKENFDLFAEYWPAVVHYAESLGVKLGIENCPMLFTYDEWPGGKNMAISPVVWEQMFSMIKSDHFGLNYDPSHMIWQQMDYLAPIREFSHKLFHVHLKDAKIYQDKLDRVGILATPLEYHSPKLPGLGDVDWKAFLESIKNSGYTGPVVIEFEDKAFEGNYEDVVKGMILARDHVRQFL